MMRVNAKYSLATLCLANVALLLGLAAVSLFVVEGHELEPAVGKTIAESAAPPVKHFAQYRRGWGRWPEEAQYREDGRLERGELPDWQVDPKFNKDVFTFVRIRYTSWTDRGNWGKWRTDHPDSDLNFPFRLQQLTSLKVNPEPLILDLTDERLFDYPFIYLIEPGQLIFGDDEVLALRRYLLNGGFLMVDDFWGDDEYENFASEMKRVFPDKEPKELDLSHDIFQCVYPLAEKPQVPSIHSAVPGGGRSWEGGYGDTRTPHYKGLFDDKDRMMAIICHNTDLGDGWEREGVAEWYFREYSEKWSYPMGINIVVYAMTH